MPASSSAVAAACIPGPVAPRFKTDGNDWYAGVFTGYQFSNRVALSVNYDRFRADDLDTDLASVGLEYAF